MDNNIGYSLFQGNNDIQVRNEEIDEEEEKADQIRRNNELAENLDKYLQIEDDTMDQNDQSLFESHFENDGGGNFLIVFLKKSIQTNLSIVLFFTS